MQNPHTTQKGQLQGGSYSGQGGGHGHHGPGRLHQQGPSITTRHQHLQSANQGSHQPTQKQTNLPSQRHQTKWRPYYPQIQTGISHKCSPPKFYGLPKIHKTGTPLRPIVSSRGSITYGVAKELSHIIKPLLGQSPHHLKNTQHFIQQLQGKRLEPGEAITSFDVKALFTSVPVQPSILIVKQRLQQDNTRPQRTSMSISQITSLLEFCLTHTYFLFQGKYYEQVQGAAMGSPISPLIANIFMEEFEVKALNSFPHPPSLWLRFVDDTFVINKAEHSQDLLQHINNQDPHIQFTVEPTQQGSLPFLNTLVIIEPDNTFITTIYRKPTHADQYLHWDSNHHITAKQSVFNTLEHRAKTVSSSQDKMDRELQHIKTALQHCQFPSWALNQWQHKFTHPNQHTTTTSSTSNNNSPADNNKNKATIVVPYIPNTGEKFKKLCKKKGTQVHFKGTNTLRTALGNPRIRTPKITKQGSYIITNAST